MTPKTVLAVPHSAFVAEAEEHLRSAGANLLALEAAARLGEVNVKAMRELFRSVHTIKGLSAMVAIQPIVLIAHRMETALRPANQSGGMLAAASIDAMLQGVEAIGQRLRQASEGRPVDAAPEELLGRLGAVQMDLPAAALGLTLDPGLLSTLSPLEQQQLKAGLSSGQRAVRAEFVPSSASTAQGVNITSIREAVGRLGDIVKVIPVSGPQGLLFALLLLTREPDTAIAAAMGVELSAIRLIAAPPGAALEGPAPGLPGEEEATSTQGWGVVRVDVARLDDAMDRLSALIVTRFRLVAAVARMTGAGVDTRELVLIAHDLTRQQRDLKATILKMRMVSVAEVLERVPLLFRSLKLATGKRVRLELDVGKAELDKAVAERLFPAIVHLVSNAVDHAIEAPEARRAAGKPEEGVVRISCVEYSNTRLELVVSDDGCGIDAAHIARRAHCEVPPTDEALLELLCVAGLSTRDRATTTSGRGMGMDIIRRIAVEQLGGDLSLRTAPGRGTTFTLRVPLTVSIVDAFSLESGGQRFLVPVAAVEEILDIDPQKLIRAPDSAERGARSAVMLQSRGETIPMLSLQALFSEGEGTAARKALIIRRGGEPMAFAVDRMLGQQEVVVRPLEDPLVRVIGVSGSTDLGDGKPTLVLDLLSLTASLLAHATTNVGAGAGPLGVPH
ncbi:MAG: chemotaxis protein CheA [Myxococcaceae bacterium]